MGALYESITKMRHPLTYAIDVVGGVRVLGRARLRRVIAENVLLSSGVGGVVTAVGVGALEVSAFLDPAEAATLFRPATAEAVGFVLSMGVAAGLLQGMHQVSNEGQAARDAGQAARRNNGRRDGGSRESGWLQ